MTAQSTDRVRRHVEDTEVFAVVGIVSIAHPDLAADVAGKDVMRLVRAVLEAREELAAAVWQPGDQWSR